MAGDVETWCRKCERCTVAKAPIPTIRHLTSWLWISQCWNEQLMARSVFMMMDVFCEFSRTVPCRDQKATTVAKVLIKEWFQKYGVPRRLHSDQGQNFESQLLKDLCTVYGTLKSCAYHPQGKGQCERFNRTLHNLLHTLSVDQRKRWPEYMQELVFIRI